MANQAIDKFLQNASKIILLALSFMLGFVFYIESINIHGGNVPVIFKDFPEVFVWASIFIIIGGLTTHWAMLLSLHESIFTNICRWCCVVSFALAVCLLFICHILSSAVSIDSGCTYEEL